MSRGPGSSSHGHIYGLPTSSDHDRHIQRIIDHTNSLFPEPQYSLPQLMTPSSIPSNEESYDDRPGQTTGSIQYGDLDDFGTLINRTPVFVSVKGADFI